MAIHPKSVLIVDDALIVRQRIRQIALEAEWTIAGEATNGEEAVALFQETDPDLVTLDIVMPTMDGVQALEEMKRIDSGANVVMISAVNQRDKLAECIRLGAVDFIVKPFDRDHLLNFFQARGKE